MGRKRNEFSIRQPRAGYKIRYSFYDKEKHPAKGLHPRARCGSREVLVFRCFWYSAGHLAARGSGGGIERSI